MRRDPAAGTLVAVRGDVVNTEGTGSSGDPRVSLAERYRSWADVGARGMSPAYEALAHAVADRTDVLDLLLRVDSPRRQPNLLFGALRWHGAPVTEPAAALDWASTHPDLVLDVLRTRRTQTNEAARCALLLPALSRIAAEGAPLALVEIGASAGLCLLPDRWRYRYRLVDAADDPLAVHEVGPSDSPVRLDCRVTGPAPLPDEVPAIGWRAGLDLDPVDATDPDARRWLECLVWPEHVDRADRLHAALAVAAADPPPVHRGDATTDLAALLDRVPDGLTTVVTHSAALMYVSREDRGRLVDLLRERGIHRLGAEGPDVVPGTGPPPPLVEKSQFWLTLDDHVLAACQPHGRWLAWTSPPPPPVL